MCDRRVHGNPVSQDLKFIAACNPYRRSVTFIVLALSCMCCYMQTYPRDDNKAPLRWAGVLCEGNRHTAETRFDKLFSMRTYNSSVYLTPTGKIPLRELVYRVIDLPPSMRPLVYDFGQLNTDTERDYTTQIVHDHVSSHKWLPLY